MFMLCVIARWIPQGSWWFFCLVLSCFLKRLFSTGFCCVVELYLAPVFVSYYMILYVNMPFIMWGGVGLAWGGMLAFGLIWFQCWCCGDDGTDDTIWWWCSVAKCGFGRWCTVSRHHGCHLSVRSWPQRWQGLDRYVHAERMRVSKCEAVSNKSVENRRRFFFLCLSLSCAHSAANLLVEIAKLA